MTSSRPLLGIGWDVGGWAGAKQAVAVARWTGSTVAWLGVSSPFRLTHLPDHGGTLLDLIRLAWPDAPDDLLERERVIIAIDAPLGFPLAFTQLVTGTAVEAWPMADEIDNPFAYRETERWVRQTHGKKPLSAPFDRLGNNATVALHLIQQWARTVPLRLVPRQPDDGQAPVVIEVYPALVKTNGQQAAETIARLIPEDMSPGTDQYDAAISAVLALAYGGPTPLAGLPPLVGPPASVAPTTLAIEGWIYAPAREQ